MPRNTPSEAAAKWASRTKNAVPEYRSGILGVTDSPMEKAADQADKYLAGVQNAVSSGKYVDRLRGVSLQSWQDKAVNVGAARIAAGVDAAESDVQRVYEQLFPFEENLQRQVDAMPDTTPEDSINRMVAWSRGMMEFHRT